MAVYAYRCTDHGATEASHPIGTAAATTPCPVCGQAAARVITAPRLSLGSANRRALIDRTERTRDEPDVVSAPPGRPGRPRTIPMNPAMATLPRP